MKRVISIVVLACATACGGGSKKEETTTTTAGANVNADVTANVNAAAVLTMQPASLSATIEGKPMELTLDASGQVMMNGQLVATLTPAGEAKDAGGKTVATMAADGRVTLVEEPSEDVVILEDGSVQAKGEAILGIGGDGILAGKLISEQDAKIAYKGAPESKRAMMLAWLVVSMGVEAGDPPPASGP